MHAEKSIGFSVILIFIMVTKSLVVLTTASANCEIRLGTLSCDNYIPVDIPEDVRDVKIADLNPGIAITGPLFAGKGWANISSLTIKSNIVSDHLKFKPNCFEKFIQLKELHIHVPESSFEIGSFEGLRDLNFLDLSNSSSISQKEMLQAVFATGTLPGLQTLKMARSGTEAGLLLDEPFWHEIGIRPISYIDISYVRANVLNASAMADNLANIKRFIARGLLIGTLFHVETLYTRGPNISVFDFSDTYLGTNTFCTRTQITTNIGVVANMDLLIFFSNVKEIICNNMCPLDGLSTFHYIRNVRNITFKSHVPWNLKSLTVNKNRLAYVDVTITGNYSKMESLSLSENSMEYLNPNILSSVYALKYLDLSGNRLDLMCRQNSTDFQILILSLLDLRHINLSRNDLTFIPKTFFSSNSKLEVIDLSENALDQVHLTMKHIKHLAMLNLSHNTIHALDKVSRNSLDPLLQLGKVILDLSENPFTCQVCEHLESIEWLVKNRNGIFKFNDLKCASDNSKSENINDKTIKRLHEVCEREKIIIVSSTTGGVIFCLSVSAVILIWRYLSRKRKLILWRDIIRRFVNRDAGYEFVAFLSYSSADEDTVLRYILPPLEGKLQEIVGVRRDLVCTGDKHFHLGYPIYDATKRCFQSSCTVIFIISDSFCQSEFCTNEFLQAYEMRKPIFLMIKEACNVDLMPDALKDVFTKNTRIIWLANDDNFQIKTTWENICNSILDICLKPTSH